MTGNKQIILDFATAKHQGQFRKNSNLPYITHPIQVAINAKIINLTDEYNWPEKMVYAVSLTHDLQEDCYVTDKELLAVFTEAGFDNWEANRCLIAVNALTKPEIDFDIIEYLREIKADKLAKLVKLADLEHNMSDLKPGNLLDKYKLCRYFLTH